MSILKKEIIRYYIKASAHIGHLITSYNPKMIPYLLFTKGGHHIFDIFKASKLLYLSGKFLQKIALNKGTFLFVGTTPLISPIILKHAVKCNNYYINYRWIGGLLTNWSLVQNKISELNRLEAMDIAELAKKLSKKEYQNHIKKIFKLNKLFNGIKKMTVLPDAVIFVNPTKEINAIQECLNLGIPVISIVDSNCNPDVSPYIIPANDDSRASINFILDYLVSQILTGYQDKNKV